jgi:hypothetical protein
MPDNDTPLPPVTFEFFTASLKMQTEMHLGLFHFGQSEEDAGPDFRLARHSIDLLAMIEQKTKGNLTMEEQRFLENTLTELRFRYIQALEHSNSEKSRIDSSKPDASKTEPNPEPVSETPIEATPSGEEQAAG